MVKASRAHGVVPSRGSPRAFTRTALSRPFRHRFSPVQASPHNMSQRVRRPSRVKLAVIYGARSALRRWSCSNCERCCQRIHCVRKPNGPYLIMFRAKRPLYLRHIRHRRVSRDWCFPPARVEENSRASPKRRQTS